MSENFLPSRPVISTWLDQASRVLEDASVPSARLDAELILAHTMRKDRTYLHAHSDDEITEHHLEAADARIQARADRTPLAYITGSKEFYGRNFCVTPAVLIPRPESETIITLLREVIDTQSSLLPIAKKLVDIGTGSGCLGITAKLEFPELSVILTDNSRYALKVAEENAQSLHADVTVMHGSLLSVNPGPIDYILANLPYVDKHWERSIETNYEPSEALFADDDGLALIKRLICETPFYLRPDGYLLLEADPVQHRQIIDFASDYRLQHMKTVDYVVCLHMPS